MTLQDLFAACYIINLPERTDRRREMEQELVAARLTAPSGWAEFFPAVKPSEAGPFPSIGARGCFLSHLGVLRQAQTRGLPNLLVMEDDLTLSTKLVRDSGSLLAPLAAQRWDIAYLGHMLAAEPTVAAPFREHTGPIQTAHFLAINGSCMSRLITFLEVVLSRPAGHPDGGPMHVDGAFSTFRQQNPDGVTLVATQSLGGQRSSRSDITPNWTDRTPVLRSLMTAGRSVRRWLRGSDRTGQAD